MMTWSTWYMFAPCKPLFYIPRRGLPNLHLYLSCLMVTNDLFAVDVLHCVSFSVHFFLLYALLCSISQAWGGTPP